MVRLNDDKLLKSTTEGGRLFHIKAVRSVKKWRLTFVRLTFNKTLYGLPLVGTASFRSVKKFWRLNINKLKNKFIHQNQVVDNATILKTTLF